MGLSSFAQYQALRKQDHTPSRMGFAPTCRTGDINIFANRVRLARSFQGINLNGYTRATITGYNAFFQIFLTHSALECFMRINGLEKPSELEPLILPHEPQPIVAAFFENDPKLLLYTFLYTHIDNKYLKTSLEGLKSGATCNVAFLSAAIRHIFAHGHLTAHAAGIQPRRVQALCHCLSDFLLSFMDTEFTSKIMAYSQTLPPSSSQPMNQ